jgi:hypothetical protein
MSPAKMKTGPNKRRTAGELYRERARIPHDGEGTVLRRHWRTTRNCRTLTVLDAAGGTATVRCK